MTGGFRVCDGSGGLHPCPRRPTCTLDCHFNAASVGPDPVDDAAVEVLWAAAAFLLLIVFAGLTAAVYALTLVV